MGIVNVIATASIAVANAAAPIGPIGIPNTDTNTKVEIVSEESQEKMNTQEETKEAYVKTEEEAQNDEMLARWKEKQAALWENLPTESFTINASAYTAAVDECGKSDGITASGIEVQEKRTLACPKEYPFGAIIEIEGMGQYRCEDRGGAIKGNHFDIYMETKGEAFDFGRRNLVAWVKQD